MMKKNIDYRGYRYPPEIIGYAVWLCHRCTLSFRDIEDLLNVESSCPTRPSNCGVSDSVQVTRGVYARNPIDSVIIGIGMKFQRSPFVEPECTCGELWVPN